MGASPQHVTLVAGVVSTVTFDADFARIEVTNVDGAAAVYFRMDGVDPVAAAEGTYVLPAAIGRIEVPPGTAGVTVVKLISAGTPKVSVRGIR